jgi:hypothetical protein
LENVKDQTHSCHILAVKKALRYNTQSKADQAYDCDPKTVCLARLSVGLLRGIWGSRLSQAANGQQKRRIKESRDQK